MIYMDESSSELTVIILKSLSNGSPIALSNYAKPNSRVAKKTLLEHLHELEYYFRDCYEYDQRAKAWKAKRQRFLDDSALSAEEAVVLSGIRRNSGHYGVSLDNTVHKLTRFVSRRRHIAALQNSPTENFRGYQKLIRKVENATHQHLYIEMTYKGFDGNPTTKTTLPLRAVNIEYYWYLVAIEQGKSQVEDIRYYSLYNIESIEITDQICDPNMHRRFRREVRHTHLGMNAYYKPYLKTNSVFVLVPEGFCNYLERSPFFSLWERGPNPALRFKTKELEGEKTIEVKHAYVHYSIPSTDEKYRDIIPAIQKYFPQIIVPDIKANQSLLNLLKEANKQYQEHSDILNKLL